MNKVTFFNDSLLHEDLRPTSQPDPSETAIGDLRRRDEVEQLIHDRYPWCSLQLILGPSSSRSYRKQECRGMYILWTKNTDGYWIVDMKIMDPITTNWGISSNIRGSYLKSARQLSLTRIPMGGQQHRFNENVFLTVIRQLNNLLFGWFERNHEVLNSAKSQNFYVHLTLTNMYYVHVVTSVG